MLFLTSYHLSLLQAPKGLHRKASDKILSTAMLVCLFGSLSTCGFLLADASKTTCILQILIALPWPVVYLACMFIKTNRLRVLFKKTRRLTRHRILLLSNRTQPSLHSHRGRNHRSIFCHLGRHSNPKR